MFRWNAKGVALLCIAIISSSIGGWAQQDPGPRPGTAGAGGPFPSLNANEQGFFGEALVRFMEVNSVSGTLEAGRGLGPTFNGNSCAMCHAQPMIGGSSPGLTSPQNPVPNPQVALAVLHGATNSVPPFITPNGPVREARFIRNSDGSPDGGVHGLFTIAGRSDAPGCTLAQPDFARALAFNNVIFRIPTPVFGLGLVEATTDTTLRANLAATRDARSRLGIGGSFNTSGNDGTITRFGWKAQNKSLDIFAGEAYNVEQGVTSEPFPNKRAGVAGCVFNSTPEDYSVMLNPNTGSPNYNTPVGTVSEMSSDIVNFAVFMRLSAPPTPAPPTSSTLNGASLFNKLGCALCHSPSLTTGPSPYTGMGGVTYNPYSDFALHHMGRGLSDGVSQGAAGPDQFRTAPLWGVGQRLFFMHDGRASDLLQAIKAHSSDDCRDRYEHRYGQNCGSEADAVIHNFKTLNQSQVQDLLNFLRSL
jgi:CxxC motif-containing protein (DUF1111 family)